MASAVLKATNILGRHRSVPHLERKLYHLAMGLVCFALYAFVLSRAEALLALSVLGGSWVFCDVVRFRFPRLNSLTFRVFGRLMRREELKSITGNSFYILGLIFIVLFFPKPIVLLSILFLAIGDPIAAIVGTQFGRYRIGKKSLEGSLANWAATAFASFLFFCVYQKLPMEKGFWLALACGAVSMLAEFLPSPVDDNFTIPAVSAILLGFVI